MSHTVKVIDDDKHFLIDTITRQVSSEYSKLMITNGDHNSERFTFEAPQNIEGHNMSECNSIEVHYININKTKTERVEGIYVVDDLSVEDNKIFFSWLLSRNCTSLIGTLQFSIKFKCLDENNNVDYEWNTTLFKNVTVLESISNSEAISEKYPDIFEQFKDDVINEVSNTQKSLVKSVNHNLPDSSGNVEIETGGVTSWNDLTDRPFGDINEDTLLVSHELEFKQNADGNYVSLQNYPSDANLFQQGKTYLVKWDGQEYKFTMAILNPDIGNLYIFSTVNEDTGEPWCYIGGASGYYYSTTGGTHTYELYEHVEETRRLDERFMPILTASNGKRYELIAADDGTLQLSQVE